MTSQLFHGARVLTMDEEASEAEAVAVRDGRIVAVGRIEEAAGMVDANVERIDCHGGLLLPAFIDAHCHLLAYAASLRSVDCTGARSITDIQRLIREAHPRAGWIRAIGYEETQLEEGRHPTRQDLDAAQSDVPIRLIHRGGHASVLNTAALKLVGIDSATEEPADAVIDRDVSTGEPSGLLVGMERQIEESTPELAYDELAAAVRDATSRLLRAGVTCVIDASYTNGLSAWQLFERLMNEGALGVDVVMMEGYEHLGELPEAGADGRLLRGAVKLMSEEFGGQLAPTEAELARRVEAAHKAGRQVAIHAVAEQAVSAAANTIESAMRGDPRPDNRHRIEHASVLPAGMASRLAALGISVVSQPSFVYERGERYLRLVPEAQQSRLYAFRELADAGVALAAGSDAPVTRPEPLASIAAAVGRATSFGRPIGPDQAVDVLEALRWWTSGAARVALLDGERGAIVPGAIADLTLLPRDVLSAPPGELRTHAPEAVWRHGGQVVPDVA